MSPGCEESEMDRRRLKMKNFEKKDYGYLKMYEVSAELIEGTKNYLVACKIAKDTEHVVRCEEILASVFANGGKAEGKVVGMMKAYAKRFNELCVA